MTMLRRLLACALVLLGNSGGCPCDPGLLIHLCEDWEGCEDTCEWTISGGSARIVETFHSAEHALLLDHASATRDVTVDVPPVDTLDLALVTDCRPALLEVRLEWAGGLTQQVTPVNCELLKPPSGGDRPYHSFCGDAHTARPAGATALRAIKITSLAACTVDRLVLFSRGGGC